MSLTPPTATSPKPDRSQHPESRSRTQPLTLPRILRRSLAHRRARSWSALLALTVSAAVATALLTLYADLDSKLHHEFRSFGANVVVTASTTGQPLPPGTLQQVRQAAGADALAVPFAYAVATSDRGTDLVVVGTDLARTDRNDVQHLDAWWSVDHWPVPDEKPDDQHAALIGQRAAQVIADEHTVTLRYANRTAVFHGLGHLRTGGDEDSRVYLPLAAFTAWTGLGPSTIELQIPGGAIQVNAAIARLHATLPALHVEPVRQLVEGESRIVDRTHALMYAAVLLIALTVAVSVLATLSASVLERRRDFALMKALGSSQAQLLALFLLEALVLALAGVVVGYLIGSALALAIGAANFGTATLPRLGVLPLVLLLNLIIAALAALVPLRVLRGLQPAALLKGE